MCGISGFWLGRSISDPEAALRRMNDTLWHRGPDDGDVRYWSATGLGLAHRRLAIVDLSPAGAQPMSSPSGRYTIVFNGEVYNFQRIRDELGSTVPAYKGHSDTEVMLRAFDTWGIEKSIPKFFGMFGFAVWDAHEQRLLLCRDRLGKKPLYFGLIAGSLLFGSELKALRAAPFFAAEIDRSSLASFVRHNYIPAPDSIYAGISKLAPGHFVEVKRNRSGNIEISVPVSYWSAAQEFQAAQASPFRGSFNDAKSQLDVLLRDAVAMRMISDVPLGAFLSGGVDSSLVVALMQAQSSAPVRTYTIGFSESDYNEATHAKAIAKHLGTEHTELYVSPKDALDIIPRLPDIYDEPFADSSQIPTILVCAMTRKHVTVALSGDGGDEGFLGYNRYLWWRRIWRAIGRLPKPVAYAGGRLLKSVPVGVLDTTIKSLRPFLPKTFPIQAAGERLHKIADLLQNRSPAAIYRKLVSHWDEPDKVLVTGREREPSAIARWDTQDLDAYTLHMALLDTMTYLPDDILVKVDRASMAASLETRAPLLDHRVLEFAWSLPIDYKLHGTRTKRVLSELLADYVPREMFDRPKTGFGVPLDQWLRGPLRDWAEALLDPARLKREGFFDVAKVRKTWDDHVSGARAWHYHLWDILMFQTWLDAQSRRSGP